MSTREAVKVVVRCRPLNKREQKLKCAKAVVIRADIGQVQLMKPVDHNLQILGEDPPKSFTFDAVYGDDSEQRAVFNDTGFPLVQSVLEGYNGTVFAYGQTGCGKTFSMMGEEEPLEMRGVIPSSFEQIFNAIEQDQSRRFLVTVAFIELYNEEVRDLLGDNPKQKLDLKESKDQGVFVAGLTHNIVRNVNEMKALQKRGNNNRTIGCTNMNAESSRSHSIFTIKIETSEASDTPDSSGHIRAGKLNLVDLAGSERQSKTGAEGKRLKEATKINMSLSALGNVISALVAGKGKHIPYRDSKLTRLLQDSLGGNTKTVMIACISPSTDSYDETLSTLRYANRAKNIKNKPTINEDPKDALLREYQNEIDRLKKMLQTQSEQMPSSETVSAQQGKVELSMESKQVRVVEGASTGLSQADMDILRDRLQAQHEEKARALEKEREEARQLQMRLHEEWKKIKEIQAEHEKQIRKREEKQDIGSIEPVKTGRDAQVDGDDVSAEDFDDDRDEETLNEQQKQLEMAMDVNAERGMDLDNQINGVIREMEQNESMTTEEFEELLMKKEAELEVSRQQLQKERDASNKRLAEREAQTSEESERLKEALRILESQLLEGDKTVEQEKRRHEMEMRKAEADILEQKRRERELNLEKTKAEEKKLLLEEHYGTLQEEVEASRLKMKELQKRLTVAQNDISDLQEEFEREREGLLEQIRELTRDSELYQQISQLLIAPRQLERIVKQAKWNPARERWDIPRISHLKKFPKIVIHDRESQLSDGSKTLQKRERRPFGNLEMEDEPMPELSQRRHYSSSNSSEVSRPLTSRPKTTSRLHKMDMDQAKESLQDELYQARLQKMQEEERFEKAKQAQIARQLLQQQPIQATMQSARSKNEKDVLKETLKKVSSTDRAMWNSEICVASETEPEKNTESNTKQRDIEQLLEELPSASNFQPALNFAGATSMKDELSPQQRALDALLSTVPSDLPKFQPARLGSSERTESPWISQELSMDLSRRSFSPGNELVQASSEGPNLSRIPNLPQSRPQFVPANISYEEAASSHFDSSSTDMLSSAPSRSAQQINQQGSVSRKDDVDALIRRVLEGVNKVPFKPAFPPNKHEIATDNSDHTRMQNALHNAPEVPARFEPARPSTAVSEDVSTSALTADLPSRWEPQPPPAHQKRATRSMPPSREHFAPDRSFISSNNSSKVDVMLPETPNRRPAFDPNLTTIGKFPKASEPAFLRDIPISKKLPFAPTGKPSITLDATLDPSIIADLPVVRKANFEPGPKPSIPDTTSALPNAINKPLTRRKFDITQMKRVE